MNFDETLSFVAADEIWRYAVEEKKIQRMVHRRNEFPFTFYDGNAGLMEARMIWDTNPHVWDSKVNEEVGPLPDCVCPPWMKCYCGGG